MMETEKFKERDLGFMQEALELARETARDGDIPVGAVVVRQGTVIGRGRNRRETGGGAAAHAEIEAITEAGRTLGDWRLNGCELFVTLEPCPMCAGAILAARLDRVVYGAPDPRGGALGGLFDLREFPLGGQTIVCGNFLAEECSSEIDAFFAARRAAKGKSRRLGREFYTGHADRTAPALLGKILCRRDRESGEVRRARITETECYLGTDDTACHASKGMTDRNRVMWDKGGTVYVYLCYGMHNMLNVVTGGKGEPEAVLIRGVEGYPGPGRVTKFLGIDRKLNGSDLVLSDELWIEDDGGNPPAFDAAPRIGIDYAEESDRLRPWRFTVSIES